MDGERRVCINCGYRVKELFKKYSNTLKTTNCVRNLILIFYFRFIECKQKSILKYNRKNAIKLLINTLNLRNLSYLLTPCFWTLAPFAT